MIGRTPSDDMSLRGAATVVKTAKEKGGLRRGVDNPAGRGGRSRVEVRGGSILGAENGRGKRGGKKFPCCAMLAFGWG